MILVILFFLLGAAIGGQINHAIYRFSYLRRPITPWMPPHPKASPRSVWDYIPLIGWTTMNRDESVHGSLFWLRPLLIELLFAGAFVGLYLFHVEGSLHIPAPLRDQMPVSNEVLWVWFAVQSVLLALLMVATFIDFDEFTIPDEVTVPGVILMLTAAALFPSMGLRDVTRAESVEPMTFATPTAWPSIATSYLGLIAAIGCLWFWCFALVPKTCTWRLGPIKGLSLMVASMIRPPRKTQSTLKTRPRKIFFFTKLLLAISLLGAIAITVFWFSTTDAHRISLLTSLLGMTFGMCMIWCIRIIGQLALGQEAMGFGDVTLMAMVGCYVGWQACLLILAVSAFAALILTVPFLLLRRRSTLPYGPYLSIGTVLVILFWPFFWDGYFKGIFLIFGAQNIFLVVVIMSVPLFVLLILTRLVKEFFIRRFR